MVILSLSSVLHPKFLSKGFKDELLKIYKHEFTHTSNSYGYIINVHKILEIISSEINKDNQTVIQSKCDCEIFKPEVGMEISCLIDIIHINGIFLSKHGVKIIVPSSDSYIYEDNKFVYNNEEYLVGDSICIKIIDVRYDKFTYSCVGKLILKT